MIPPFAAPGAPAETDIDVLVIGGGPAGSTAAALLAQRGFSVALADKDRHPRFHIGESLLPMNLPLFEALGCRDEIERIGMPKWAAEFVSPQHEYRLQRYPFDSAWDKSQPYAYQVRRSEFDELLLRNAERCGAQVIEQCRVSSVEPAPDGRQRVLAARNDGAALCWRARFVVDASGRDTLLANRHKLKYKNPRHASSALYGHFEGARRNPGRDAGNITIYWFEHGWLWFIPLADGATSVGAVCWPYYLRQRKVDVTTFFLDTIAMCPPLAERLAEATLVAPPTATGNYSYLSTRSYGDGYVLVGDAFAFLDPVFSSGVYFAMSGAFFAADAVETALRNPAEAPVALARYDRKVRHGIREFGWFVYRMTSPSIRDLFMGPRNILRVREALLSLLAGDIYRDARITRRLKVFKLIYYACNALHPVRTWRGWKRRRSNLAPEQGNELAPKHAA